MFRRVSCYTQVLHLVNSQSPVLQTLAQQFSQQISETRSQDFQLSRSIEASLQNFCQLCLSFLRQCLYVILLRSVASKKGREVV